MRTLSFEEVGLVSGAGDSCSGDSGSGGNNDQEQRSHGENMWNAIWVSVGSYLGGAAGYAAGSVPGAATGVGAGAAAGYAFGASTIGPDEPVVPPPGGNCPTCHDG